MEIGEQGVRDIELITGIYKDRSGALPSFYFSAIPGAFHCTDARSPHRDDLASLRFCGFDFLRGLVVNVEMFLMHNMVFDVPASHRQKSAQPHMERDKNAFNPRAINALQHVVCEMQARGRRGGRAVG